MNIILEIQKYKVVPVVVANTLEQGRNTYNELVSYGENNRFKDVLNKVGISSPFEKETIDKIAYKFEQVFA